MVHSPRPRLLRELSLRVDGNFSVVVTVFLLGTSETAAYPGMPLVLLFARHRIHEA